MRVLAAMSGGVDSSVAAARAVAAGHEVVGVTLRLWDNPGDEGCCSVAEIDDARRVCHRLGIDHLVWTFTDEFDADVVAPYVAAHAQGLTPNPCVECNRHLKFGRLIRRAVQLGFDALATGHHARITVNDGALRLHRGADPAKDQSYVLYVLGQEQLSRCLFPVGDSTKAEVRAEATALGLVTATKPDSQDVCFVTTAGGRAEFLGPRIPLRPGRVVDTGGFTIGSVDAVELVTVGQRRGLGIGASHGDGHPRYAVSTDPEAGVVVAGTREELLAEGVELEQLAWVGGHPPQAEAEVEVQCSAHGDAVPARVDVSPGNDRALVRFAVPRTRVAPGQSVVVYRSDEVLGGGIVLRPLRSGVISAPTPARK